MGFRMLWKSNAHKKGIRYQNQKDFFIGIPVGFFQTLHQPAKISCTIPGPFAKYGQTKVRNGYLHALKKW